MTPAHSDVDMVLCLGICMNPKTVSVRVLGFFFKMKVFGLLIQSISNVKKNHQKRGIFVYSFRQTFFRKEFNFW